MGKAFIVSGSAALSLFIAYTQVAPITEGTPWYLTVLWIGFVVAGILALLTGLGYLFLLVKKHRNSLDILDDWRCTYWPAEQELKVTLWFFDRSGATAFSAKCIAKFGQQVVNVNDDIIVGGIYMGKTGLISGRDQPVMVEFLKRNVELHDTSTSTIMVSIRPSSGVWATKQKTKVVSVQIVSHGQVA